MVFRQLSLTPIIDSPPQVVREAAVLIFLKLHGLRRINGQSVSAAVRSGSA